jgi:ankyrin repeat protein
MAAGYGTREACIALLDAKAHVEARARKGTTPLIGAAAVGRADIVAHLLSVGANVNALAEEDSALSRAALEKHHNTCLLLLDAKATITATAFCRAVSCSNEQTCRTFIEFKADVNAQSISYGLFPLLEAAHQNDGSRCALLLQARANPDLAARRGRKSLMTAAFD